MCLLECRLCGFRLSAFTQSLICRPLILSIGTNDSITNSKDSGQKGAASSGLYLSIHCLYKSFFCFGWIAHGRTDVFIMLSSDVFSLFCICQWQKSILIQTSIRLFFLRENLYCRMHLNRLADAVLACNTTFL